MVYSPNIDAVNSFNLTKLTPWSTYLRFNFHLVNNFQFCFSIEIKFSTIRTIHMIWYDIYFQSNKKLGLLHTFCQCVILFLFLFCRQNLYIPFISVAWLTIFDLCEMKRNPTAAAATAATVMPRMIKHVNLNQIHIKREYSNPKSKDQITE